MQINEDYFWIEIVTWIHIILYESLLLSSKIVSRKLDCLEIIIIIATCNNIIAWKILTFVLNNPARVDMQ